MENEKSGWNVYGPFYSVSALERCNIPVTDDLITIKTKEGVVLYPQGQFEVDDYGFTILGRRERVIKVYGDVLMPAIQSGEVSYLTALNLIIAPKESAPSRADIIADPNTPQSKVDSIAASIASTLTRWRHDAF